MIYIWEKVRFLASLTFKEGQDIRILGDPGADQGGEGKSKRVEKYIRNEKK